MELYDVLSKALKGVGDVAPPITIFLNRTSMTIDSDNVL